MRSNIKSTLLSKPKLPTDIPRTRILAHALDYAYHSTSSSNAISSYSYTSPTFISFLVADITLPQDPDHHATPLDASSMVRNPLRCCVVLSGFMLAMKVLGITLTFLVILDATIIAT